MLSPCHYHLKVLLTCAGLSAKVLARPGIGDIKLKGYWLCAHALSKLTRVDSVSTCLGDYKVQLGGGPEEAEEDIAVSAAAAKILRANFGKQLLAARSRGD